MRSTHLKGALTGVAAILLVVATTACTGGGEEAPTPTLEPAPTGEVSDGGGEAPSSDPSSGEEIVAGECKVQEGNEELPTEAPAVDAWEDVAGSGIPTSEEYGPYTREGELWTCYEHSPAGAAFAAPYVVLASSADGDFARAWLTEEAWDLAEGETESEGESTATIRVVGFRYDSYTETRAVQDVALEVSVDGQTQHVSMRVVLEWVDDRWRVSAETYTADPVALESLDGFIVWER
ncbi:hypothetical protein V1260_15400 [Brachybacterium sp. J144]|uniref:hypothetical protein n=1 Tax=Brachybacterium sp. J144 TaxID=3116487 RepID=UPI002E75A091|nr:hypothetical protein [Brachybacterium sp. J144]MEE1652167.1 hypothetical protein [Brachybacterium sp. J144]